MNATTNTTDEAAAGLLVGVGIVFIIIFSIIGLLLYILPGIIASMRRHPQALPIWLVTIFLGATGIGWIAALIWAFVTPDRQAIAAPMAMPPQPLPPQPPQPYPPQAYPAAPMAMPSAAPHPASGASPLIDELAALARLRDQGVLTEAEFTARKRLLLGEEATATASPTPPAPAPVPAPAPIAPPPAAAVAPPSPAPPPSAGEAEPPHAPTAPPSPESI